jgi:hypothetical protein
MGKIKDRLWELVNEQANGQHTVFANKAGIVPTTFKNYIDGRMPNSETLINICETYKANITWILTGKGDKYIKEGGDPTGSTYIDKDGDPGDDPELMKLLDGAQKVLKQKESEVDVLKNLIACLAERTERRQAEKDDKIRHYDPPEEKEGFIKMRATSTV